MPRKGPPPLALGLLDLIALNIGLQALAIGFWAAIVRRSTAEAAQQILAVLVYPVVADFVALTALGALAYLLTNAKAEADAEMTQLDRLMAAGAPWWIGYAAFTAVLRIGFLATLYLYQAQMLGNYPELFEYLPVRPLTDLGSWQPAAWCSAAALSAIAGVAGAWALRRWPQRLITARRGLRLSIVCLLLFTAPAAWRKAQSWKPAIAGDNLLLQLRPTQRASGATWDPAGLRGRVTLAEFWTTWCGSCKRLLPRLLKIAKTQPDQRFQLLLVNVEERRRPSPSLAQKIQQYSSAKGITSRVLIDHGPWARAVGLTVFPTLALIGPSGEILQLWSGTPPQGALEQRIDAVLGALR
jgi:thiol-disulfide isomerase/thioredoxin